MAVKVRVAFEPRAPITATMATMRRPSMTAYSVAVALSSRLTNSVTRAAKAENMKPTHRVPGPASTGPPRSTVAGGEPPAHLPQPQFFEEFGGRHEERVLLQDAADDDHRVGAHDV